MSLQWGVLTKETPPPWTCVQEEILNKGWNATFSQSFLTGDCIKNGKKWEEKILFVQIDDQLENSKFA